MNEDELAQHIRQLQELKKQDPDIDVAALAMKALAGHQADFLTPREKGVAYLVSLAVPPLGLVFAIKFFLSEKQDAKRAAVMCLGLTLVSIALFVVLINLMVRSAGLTPEQLQQAPGAYRELLAP